MLTKVSAKIVEPDNILQIYLAALDTASLHHAYEIGIVSDLPVFHFTCFPSLSEMRTGGGRKCTTLVPSWMKISYFINKLSEEAFRGSSR